MDSVLHLHVSDRGIMVRGPFTSWLGSTEGKDKKLKIHFAASAVKAAGWEGLLGIPTLKQMSEMTESEIQ